MNSNKKPLKYHVVRQLNMNVQEIFQLGNTEWLLHSGQSEKKKMVGELSVFKLILIHKSLRLNITLKELY